MKTRSLVRSWLVALVVIGFSTAALAGPPLICHAIDIGNAKSLPWVSHGWNLNGNENYDVRRLAADTLAILDADPTVLVHMETLRRATLYAKTDPQVAKELVQRLHARAEKGNALAVFDEGYLVEAYRQWLRSESPAAGTDGYALVKRAIAKQGNPQMEFAAALMMLDKRPEERSKSSYNEHVEKATAGAKSDPLLARNLQARFHGDGKETIAELFRM